MYYKCIPTEFDPGGTPKEIEVQNSSLNLGNGASSSCTAAENGLLLRGGEVTSLVWCASSILIFAVAATFCRSYQPSSASIPLLLRTERFLRPCTAGSVDFLPDSVILPCEISVPLWIVT